MEFSAPLLTLIGTLLLAIGALLGVVINARLKREESVYARLQRVEDKEAKCQADLFDLRSDMQTMWLALELILKENPQVENQVMEATVRVKARQREFLHKDSAELNSKG